MADPTASRSRIFISYRRQDTEHPVGRLAEDLRRHFGRDQVFQDFTSIDPGVDFVEAVQKGLATCAAVLVAIGPKWLAATDDKGRRRLDLPGDWVAHEVAESLRVPEVRVFPVLVGAEMPSEEDLPASLRSLTRRQAFPLTGRHWPSDVALLVEFLKKVPGLTASRAPATAATDGPQPAASSPGRQKTGSRDASAGRVPTDPDGGASEPAPARIPWKTLAAIAGGVGIAVVLFSLSWKRPGVPSPKAPVTSTALQTPSTLSPAPTSIASPRPGSVVPAKASESPSPRAAKDTRLRHYKVDVLWCDESGASALELATEIRRRLDQTFEFARTGGVKQLTFGGGPWASGYEVRVDPDGSEDLEGKLLMSYLRDQFADPGFSGWASQERTSRYLSVFVCPGARSTAELDERQRLF
jgi:hypothetical protein